MKGAHCVRADFCPAPFDVCGPANLYPVRPSLLKFPNPTYSRPVILPLRPDIFFDTVHLQEVLKLAFGHGILKLRAFFQADNQSLLDACTQFGWPAHVWLLNWLLPAQPVG